jgi:hypothetical protein
MYESTRLLHEIKKAATKRAAKRRRKEEETGDLKNKKARRSELCENDGRTFPANSMTF